MINILALDASTEICSVALRCKSGTWEKVSDKPRSHANELLPMVDQVLTEGGLRLTEIDAIAFGAGPGSFTGLRICLGVVQGLAFAADKPVVAVSSLKAMAMAEFERDSQTEHVVSAIDARMSEVYWAAYRMDTDSVKTVLEPQVAPIAKADETLRAWLVDRCAVGVGSGWPLLNKSAKLLRESKPSLWPRAATVALLGEQAYRAGDATDAMSAEPVYLRTEISWKKRERIRR